MYKFITECCAAAQKPTLQTLCCPMARERH